MTIQSGSINASELVGMPIIHFSAEKESAAPYLVFQKIRECASSTKLMC